MNRTTKKLLEGFVEFTLIVGLVTGCGGGSAGVDDGGLNGNSNNNNGTPSPWSLHFYPEAITYDASSHVLTIRSLIDAHDFPSDSCGWARYNEAMHVFADEDYSRAREFSWAPLSDEAGEARAESARTNGALQVEVGDGQLVVIQPEQIDGYVAVSAPSLFLVGTPHHGIYDFGLYVQCGAGRFCGDLLCLAEESEDATTCPADCGCQNGILNPGEECDGYAYGGMTCVDFGFSGGLLGCNDCVITTDDCTML